MPDDVGLRRDDHLQQFGPGVEIGNKELNGGVGILRPDGTHGFRPMRRTSVGEVVARYRGYDDIPKSHQTDTLGQLGGFRRIGRQRTARSCGAKTAAPCTDIPEDHESRRTALQHSALFGHIPLLQIVCKECSLTMCCTSAYAVVRWSRIFSQSGFLSTSALSYNFGI